MTDKIPGWRFITIHCSATENGKKVNIEVIRKDHIARGFSDIGYHFLVQPDGVINIGRSLTKVGAHVKGHNVDNIGLCLIGNDKFYEEQLISLETLIRQLQIQFFINDNYIYFHREFDTAVEQGKTCPNINKADFMKWFQNPHDFSLIKDSLLT